MGHTTAVQVGNYLSGIDYSFFGLEKSVTAGFEPGGIKRKIYDQALAEVSQHVKVVMPEKISADSIPCEFTGSPKTAGYLTKEEFLKAAKEKGYHRASFKDAKVLFTDNLNSNSSKMTTARAKGIKIMLYSDLNNV